MEPERIIVAQAPSPLGIETPIPVGVVRWRGPAPALSVIFKVSLSYAEGDGEEVTATLADAQEPLSTNRFEKDAGGVETLVYASDFVPFKEDADVLLRGHGYALPEGIRYSSGEGGDLSPETRVDGIVEVGDMRRTLVLMARGRRDTVPLSAPFLRDPADSDLEAEPVGPIATQALLTPPEIHPEDFDYSAYQAASHLQRTPWILPGATIRLRGLSPRSEERRITLPGLWPRAFADFADRDEPVELQMVCDTLSVDVDAETLTLLYRGEVPLTSLRANDLARLVVTVDPGADPRSLGEILRQLPRGKFFYAARPEDAEPLAKPIPSVSPELTAARYASWGHEQSPDPALSLEEFAQVSAELSEQIEPRGDTLRRHRLDDDAWSVEERAWLEAIGASANEPNGGLAAEFGRLFVEAQDKLGAPEEDAKTLSDYARIRANNEKRDPSRVLADEKMTLPAWLRLDRRMRAWVAQDQERRKELSRLIEAERPRVTPDPAPADDDDDDEET